LLKPAAVAFRRPQSRFAEPPAGAFFARHLSKIRFKPWFPLERENNPAQVTLSQPGNPA
jgi:hypothetical protein